MTQKLERRVNGTRKNNRTKSGCGRARLNVVVGAGLNSLMASGFEFLAARGFGALPKRTRVPAKLVLRDTNRHADRGFIVSFWGTPFLHRVTNRGFESLCDWSRILFCVNKASLSMT